MNWKANKTEYLFWGVVLLLVIHWPHRIAASLTNAAIGWEHGWFMLVIHSIDDSFSKEHLIIKES
jgi:hypothetical protein